MKKLLFSLFIIGLITACGDKKKDFLVKVKTVHGDMIVILYDKTPLHKKNFLELAKLGTYDSTTFHRIMEDFMIQGGDVTKKDGNVENQNELIPAEFIDGYYHTKGALAAARQPDAVNPDKKSSSTQFYIVDGMSWEMMSVDIQQLNQRMSELLQDTAYAYLLKQFQELAKEGDNKTINKLVMENKGLVEEKYKIDLTVDISKYPTEYQGVGGTPFLDGEYTVFGKVIDGLEIIDKIAAVETSLNPMSGEKSTPITPLYVSMEVIEMKKKKVTETYGYEYPAETKE